MRRQFALPPEDVEFLDVLGQPWEALEVKGQWLLIHELSLPRGYTETQCSVAIRIESGYPITALDMAYFRPFVVRSDKKPIPATDSRQDIDGQQWQRWSRHRTPQNPWQPGQDNIESHYLLIRYWLEKEFKR